MGKYVSNAGYDALEATSELGQLWSKQAKKKAAPKIKRPRGRPRKVRADFGAPMVMGDLKPFVSPIDGSEISSRSKLRAHEQAHKVKQCGDFKKGEIIAKENKRIAQSLEQAKGATSQWE